MSHSASPHSASPHSASPYSASRWADLRDFCSAVREVVIILAMLSLLVVPSAVRNVLERAGIRSLAGVEFDVDNIAQSQDELNAALVQIDELRNQLANAQQQVQGLAESSPAIAALPSTSLSAPSASSAVAPAARTRSSPSLSSISQLLATMQSQAAKTDKSLRRSKDHTEKFLEHAGRQVTLVPPEELFRNRELVPSSAAQTAELDELRR